MIYGAYCMAPFFMLWNRGKYIESAQDIFMNTLININKIDEMKTLNLFSMFDII